MRNHEINSNNIVAAIGSILRGTEYRVLISYTDGQGYELKAHINLSSCSNWQPLGSYEASFNAILEGNNYPISNLTINSTATDYVGLFAATSANAKISNVGLLNVDVQGNNYVGGLVGYNAGTIAYSHVVGKRITGTSNVGALIGFKDSGDVNGVNYATINTLEEGTGSICELIGNYDTISNKLLISCNNGLF